MKKNKRKINLIEKTTEGMGKALANFYDRQLLDALKPNLLHGEIVKYRKTRITMYLKLPFIKIEKHYDTDSEYGTGEFEGLLVSIDWFETKIPVGKKIIEVPVYKKRKGQIIKFKRYGSLDTKITT